MKNVFKKLGFKQKIIFGFSLLSAILIFGMGYMLFEFTNISQLSTNIIEKQQPIIRTSSNALEYSKSAVNHLHKFILNGDKSNLVNYSNTITKLHKNLRVLLNYPELPNEELNKNNLQRAILIVDEVNNYVNRIKKYKSSFEENHPVINAAALTLNPLALEYLGLLNSIIEQNTTSDISKEALVQLSGLRHSWTQMLSSLRITLATRQAREFANVRAYADVNNIQMNRLKKMDLDLGLEGIQELESIRKKYMKQFDIVIARFETKVWSMDAHIMATNVMPLFDELGGYLENLSSIQLNHAEKADALFSEHLVIAQYRYIALIVISFIAALLISSFITHSLRKPLVKLVNATNEVAKGNLDTGIVVIGNDEISDLGRTFNEMVSKLKESQLALTTARDNAENANDAKSQFLTRMSHELRTPLNAILGFAQILDITSSSDIEADENRKGYVKNILKSGWHLLDLVEELLDLSRIETNSVLINKEKKNILPLIQEGVAIVRPMADEHNMTMIEEFSNDYDCYINVDPIRFRQIILNFLTNAVKFNRNEGKVTIKCELVSENSIKISVCDEGSGLTEEQKSKVFDVFQRLDADKKAIGGTGIGLCIAKNLVELMDGKIGVDSTVGQGTCFWVEFPLVEAIYKPNVTDDSKLEHDKTYKTYKMLYVEDDIFNFELVRDILSVLRPNITLLEAMTAEIGLEIAERENLDLVLMDLNLPGMSGQEALIELKRSNKTADIPVIAISADAVEESILSCKELGFNDYITKPINVDNFILIVDATLESLSTN